MNILIIEDDVVTLKALKCSIENLGHAVHAAESCEEGIGLTDSVKFDVIITDVMMPGISGLSLVSLLRSVKNFTAPIIMMSALSNRSLLDAGFKAGANDFILKPLMMEVLKDKLEKYDTANQSPRKQIKMARIKFGTDGWRAIIADDFTVDNVARVAEATAQWLLKNFKWPSAVVGYDTRFGGKLFSETVAKILSLHNIKVFLAEGFVSTPMVSLGTVNKRASIGIIITASHNPPSYNGFKLKGSYGGPMLPEEVEEIEKLIPETHPMDLERLSIKEFYASNIIESIDLETMYCDHVEKNFDLAAIRRSGLQLAYDAMYGAGQNVIKRLLPNTTLLHCENNPSFNGQAPEPIHRNLQELSTLIKNAKTIDCGLATDGDADRIGLYDNEGNFIDSNHIILLLIKYLYEQKGMRGKVATSFSVSPKVEKMCAHFGLEHQVTKIGFKYICDIMIKEDVLIGGEESGGIAIKGHIPERDGIWIGLTILEYMAKSGQTLRGLINEVYAIVGAFSFERSDLHLKEELKNTIVKNCQKNIYKRFGEYKIQRTETTDGYKYFFNDNEWLMIRASGTEPVLRNYAESGSLKNAFSILKAAEETLLNSDNS